MIELATLVKYFDDAEDATSDSRQSSELCRDFYDGNQLDAEQRRKLKARHQPEVVFNLVQPKVDFLMGYERQSRTDPKAFPRTPKHDEAADAITDAIRYVLDNNEFDCVASDVFENLLIEGTGGSAVEVDPDNFEINVKHLRWDRLFIDPYSMRKDARDARYIGYVSWKDLDEVTEMWPKSKSKLNEQMNLHSAAQTHDDKPTRWYSSTRNRVMCVDICFLHNGVWHTAIYAKGAFLEDPKPSAYVNDEGEPQCKFIVTSARVDRDGQRYGPVKNDLDKQKEVNARRSKALHLLNTRQTFGREGAIKNLNAFKREANKPDGHITYPGSGQFGKDFGIIPNEALVGPQFEMYMEAKSSMDMAGANQALQGTTDKSMSGKAVRTLQQGGMMELTPLFDVHSQWKKQVYRAVWDRIKQYWREEKWIRVTDEEENLKWVGLNKPITMAEKMISEKTGMEVDAIREKFAQELQQIYQQQPQMQQAVEVENNVAEIDVDIIIEEIPDVINLQSEQFELLVQMYQANPGGPQNPDGIKWTDVIEMSTLRNKDKLLGKDLDEEQLAAQQQQQQAAQQAQQMQQQAAMMQIQSMQAKAAKDAAQAEKIQLENQATVARFPHEMADKQAKTMKTQADAASVEQKTFQTSVETAILMSKPDPNPQTII